MMALIKLHAGEHSLLSRTGGNTVSHLLSVMINWTKVNAGLPFRKTVEEKNRRREMWKAIDVNDNGFVSLSEVTRVSIYAKSIEGCRLAKC